MPCLRDARKARLAHTAAFGARTREQRPVYEIWCLDPERAEEIRAAGFAAIRGIAQCAGRSPRVKKGPRPMTTRSSPAIQRLALTWSAIGTAEEVARALEGLARKVRAEGEAVGLKASIRYQAAKARKARRV